MNYSVWINDKNEYLIGSYSYSYFTDSFTVSYIKEDKNIGKLSWFKVTTYDNTNFGGYKNIGTLFKTLRECYMYVNDRGGINLSAAPELLNALEKIQRQPLSDAENMHQAVEKAVADRANLAGANLAGANLAGANLDGEPLIIAPISITNLTWPILITHGYMRIGCQRHSHEEWNSFDEENIKKMHGRASEFWEVWKEPLLAMCAKHYEEAMKVKGD